MHAASLRFSGTSTRPFRKCLPLMYLPARCRPNRLISRQLGGKMRKLRPLLRIRPGVSAKPLHLRRGVSDGSQAGADRRNLWTRSLRL